MEKRVLKAFGVVSVIIASGSFACSRAVEPVGQTQQSLASVPITASISVSSSWSGGYCANVKVTNQTSSAVSGWSVLVRLNASSVSTIWNATSSVASGQLTATSVLQNAFIPPGSSTEFGFCAAGAQGKPTVLSATGTPPDAVPAGLSAKISLTSDWSAGYCADVVITNGATTTASTWAVVLELAQSRMTNVWNASSSTTGTQLRLAPLAFNAVLAPGASTTVGFCANKTGTNYKPTIVSPPELPRKCGTIAGLVCRTGEYCDLGVGTCLVKDAAGLCKTLPAACTDVVTPVCGCDGVTYSNACKAAAAGVGVDYAGECPRKCGTVAGLVCRTGEYCDLGVGACRVSDAAGVCKTLPAACTDVVTPVCGCDGVTYINACKAAAAGVSVDYAGECPRKCGTVAGLACRTGEFCEMSAGSCRVSDAAGVCKTLPAACPDVVTPVCGCDGVTYTNACKAAAAGVNVDYAGECPRKCGTIAGLVCRTGEFCEMSAGSCRVSDAAGVCKAVPTMCPLLSDPVCGCDGKTYGNTCEATMAGVNVDYAGECPRKCGTLAGLTCSTGEYCEMGVGGCLAMDPAGTCRVPPTACPDVVDPVCGCDALDYTNACMAAMKGVSVEYAGTCARNSW